MLSNAFPKETTPTKKSAQLMREGICKRWKEAIEDRGFEHELTLPKNGLNIPVAGEANTEAIVITDIMLKMKLVYDNEFSQDWEGDYASPYRPPTIEIYIVYQGEWQQDNKLVLDLVANVIAGKIGKAVAFSEDNWSEPAIGIYLGKNVLRLDLLDDVSSWNIADFLLAKGGYKGDNQDEKALQP